MTTIKLRDKTETIDADIKLVRELGFDAMADEMASGRQTAFATYLFIFKSGMSRPTEKAICEKALRTFKGSSISGKLAV